MHISMSVLETVITGLLGLVTIIQQAVIQRGERRREAMEAERRSNADTTAAIVAERTELTAENKAIRVDLRMEIDRLNAEARLMREDIARVREEAAQARTEIAHWQKTAGGWQEKYERETLNNVQLHRDNNELRDHVSRLQEEVTGLRGRLDLMQTSAKSAARSKG